jgi:large subunit ribosomal protein L24
MKTKNPKKQRKMRANAPLHIRHKLISAHVSKELRKEIKRRSLPLRKGDLVKIMRGKYKGKSGKVIKVSLKKLKVFIEGIKRKNVSGRETEVAIDPSNLMIISAALEDERRKKVIERKFKLSKGVEK